MRHQTLLLLVLFPLLIWASPAFSGEPESAIYDIGFENIPGGTRMAGTAITLSGDGLVEGRLQVNGEIESAIGVRFPDGTVQTSANSTDLNSLTANDGLYNNRIVLMTPPNDYTEVCIVKGQLLFDLHPGGESTTDGATQNCNPGDVGWLIEQEERDQGTPIPWSQARLNCLIDGMRLPEPFEWQVSCDQRLPFDMESMPLGPEWASNQTHESSLSNDAGIATLVFGGVDQNNADCQYAGLGYLGRSLNQGLRNEHRYRCAR